MQTKLILPLIIGALILSGGSFYGGTIYAKKNLPANAAGRQAGFGNGNFAAGARGGNGIGGTGRGAAGGFSNGEVVSKDASSLILKLRDGGSKNVFYSSSTTIGKMTNGSIDDVTVGESITVSGTPNQDGSIAATMIQLRPQGMPGDNTGRMAPPVQNGSR